MEIKWLKRALENLDTIAGYLARDNPEAARSLVRSIREKTEHLSSFPFMGRASENPDTREFFVHQHYLVSYRIRPGRIEILQVWLRPKTEELAHEAGGEAGVGVK